jgi:hypothetical protein
VESNFTSFESEELIPILSRVSVIGFTLNNEVICNPDDDGDYIVESTWEKYTIGPSRFFGLIKGKEEQFYGGKMCLYKEFYKR